MSQEKKKKAAIIGGIIVAAVLAVYLGCSVYFGSHFYFRSTINGVKASGASVEKVKERLEERAKGYTLTVIDGKGQEETITPDEIGMEVDIQDQLLENLLESQNGFAWIKYVFVPTEHTSDHIVSYQEDQLEERVHNLRCLQDTDVTETKDATYTYEDGSFEIVDEVYGTRLDEKTLREAVIQSVQKLHDTLDLEQDNCYVQPEVTADTEELKDLVKELNDYADVKITYEIGSKKEEIPKDTIASWLYGDENLKVQFQQGYMQDFVKSMARKYNTYGQSKTLMTSYGRTVTVPGGNYGWKISVEDEVAQLMEDISSKKDVSRDFVYSVKANSHGENDYGDSYVEINLTAQQLYLYKNGQQLLKTDFVSGNISKKNGTHTGAFKITYKEKNATLKGTDYRTPVSYWMPFNGNEGMHDATWRKNFGGSIYMKNGSHGCVNLPLSAAKTIFENVEAGFPVLVYTLEGTESVDQETVKKAQATVDAINAIGEVTLERAGYVTTAREKYNALSSAGKQRVTNYEVLQNAENKLNEIYGAIDAAIKAEEKNQAASVSSLIASISAQGTPAADNTAWINAVNRASQAYDALSPSAKSYVSDADKSTLSAARQTLASLQ